MPSTPVIVQRTLIITMRPCDLGGHRMADAGRRRTTGHVFQSPSDPMFSQTKLLGCDTRANRNTATCSISTKNVVSISKFMRSWFCFFPAIEIFGCSMVTNLSPNPPRKSAKTPICHLQVTGSPKRQGTAASLTRICPTLLRQVLHILGTTTEMEVRRGLRRQRGFTEI